MSQELFLSYCNDLAVLSSNSQIEALSVAYLCWVKILSPYCVHILMYCVKNKSQNHPCFESEMKPGV